MQMRKAALLLAAVLSVQLAIPAYAEDLEDTYYEEPIVVENGWEDPELVDYSETLLEIDDDGYPHAYEDVTTRELKKGEVLRRGVDVSSFQNTIDWKKVKASGVEFAFVRAGYRGWGTGKIVKDPRVTTYTNSEGAKVTGNIEGALDAGVKVGLYIYSQAITPEEGEEEAQFLIDYATKYNITLPLVIDFEFAESGGYTGRLYEAKLSKEEATAVCNAFCDKVRAAGFTPAVYANKFMLNNHLNPSALTGEIWLAQYRWATDYSGEYTYWQFTSRGEVPGISGYADLDFWFDSKNADPAPIPVVLPFTDVSKNDWFYNAVYDAYVQNLIKGKTETSFDPYGKTTRAELAVMVYRMAGSPAAVGSTSFTDLSADWYRKAVTWANRCGYINGTSGTTFEPDALITRQDIVTILWRIAGKPSAGSFLWKYYDGSDVAAYAVSAMNWAVEQQIVSGSYGYLRSNQSATRAEVAAMLTRYMDGME